MFNIAPSSNMNMHNSIKRIGNNIGNEPSFFILLIYLQNDESWIRLLDIILRERANHTHSYGA
jgi:hypothetical protein